MTIDDFLAAPRGHQFGFRSGCPPADAHNIRMILDDAIFCANSIVLAASVELRNR
jgi:hypothetical protein